LNNPNERCGRGAFGEEGRAASPLAVAAVWSAADGPSPAHPGGQQGDGDQGDEEGPQDGRGKQRHLAQAGELGEGEG